jgi:2-methylcitrate dehydratase
MSAVNRTLRTASKQLRFQSPRGLRVAAPLVARSAFGAARSSLPASHGAAFSTSAARRSGAPNMSSADREYDPEIKDIADYVANKTIDSELAVSFVNLPRRRFCTPAKYPALKLLTSTPTNYHENSMALNR